MNNFKSFFKSLAFKQVSTLTIGTIVSQCIFFISLPFLTRLYGPVDFGEYAITLAIVNILAVLFSFKFEVEILSPQEDREASNLILLCFCLIISCSLLVTLVAWIIPWQEIKFFDSSLKEFESFIGLFAGLTSSFGVSQWWLNRFGKYNEMAFLRIFQVSVFVFLSFLFSNYSLSASSLIWSQFISVIISVVIAFYLIREVSSHWIIYDLKALFKKYIKTPKFILPSAMMDVVSQQLPLFMIALLFSIEMSGQFSFAWKLTFIPMTLIGRAVAQVFWQRLSLIKHDLTSAGRLLTKTWLYLFISGLPMLSLLFIGEEIFILLLGEEWAPAGKISEIIVPIAFLIFITSPTSATFVLLKKQNYIFLQGLFTIVCRPLAIYLGYFFKDLELGILLLVLFESIYIILYMIVAYRLTILKKQTLFS